MAYTFVLFNLGGVNAWAFSSFVCWITCFFLAVSFCLSVSTFRFFTGFFFFAAAFFFGLALVEAFRAGFLVEAGLRATGFFGWAAVASARINTAKADELTRRVECRPG